MTIVVIQKSPINIQIEMRGVIVIYENLDIYYYLLEGVKHGSHMRKDFSKRPKIHNHLIRVCSILLWLFLFMLST